MTLDEAREIDEREIGQAIAFRRSVGMLADEGWVRSLQMNPVAEERNGIRMSGPEASEFDRRIHTQLDVAPAVQAYGEQHPDEWAGAWIDPIAGGVNVRFTGHLEEHRQAILALFGPGVATIQVHEARWTTAQLDAFNATIWTPANLRWIKDLDAQVLGGGARVVENDVTLTVAIPAPDDRVAARIVKRLDGADWLSVEVKVNPSLALPFGALSVKVVDAEGRHVVGVTCELVPDVAGAGGDDTVRDSDESGTCRWERLHATSYAIDIWGRFRQDRLGSGRVRVPTEATALITVTVRR
ncbi:MAG: hypothetical protein H0U52_11460 [Chloroflexi bacterium]|nr:hypothetical protein [Chloroflexota bacterium]